MPEIKLDWENGKLEAPAGPDEDLSSRYLLGRQLAHEYNDPATQSYIQASEAAHQAQQEAMATEHSKFREAQAKKSTEGKAKGSDFAALMVSESLRRQGIGQNPLAPAHGNDPTAPTEPVPAHVQGGDAPLATMPDPTAMGFQRPKAAAPEPDPAADTQGIPAPLIDPTLAFPAGFGAKFALSLAEGKALMPSLGRAIAAGLVNVGQDVAIGVPTDMAGAKVPELALPVNVVLALMTGKGTQSVEDGIAAAASRIGKVIKPEEIKSEVQALIDALKAGGKELSPEMVTSINRIVEETPVADVLRILKNERGELTIRDPNAPTPPANVKGAEGGVTSPPADETAPIGPNRPGMVKASQEFLADTNPDITKSYAGQASGGNIRIWSEDLQPKFLSDIQSEEDIMRVLTSTQETFAAQKEAAARGVQSWGMTEDAAKQYGITDLLGRKVGQAFNAEQIEAGRQTLVASAASLKGMADVVRSGAATDLQKMEFMRAFNVHYAIQMQMSGAAAEAGRALQVFRKAAETTDLRMGQLKDFMEGVGRSGINPEQLAERLSMMDSPGAVSAFVQQGKRATTIDMWNEAWINGMLWMPQTHLANIVSNQVVAMLAVPERLMGAMYSKIPGLGSGQLQVRESLAMAYGGVEGFKDGLKAFAKAMRTGANIDPMTKMDIARPRSITAANVEQLPAIKKIAPNGFGEDSTLAAGIDFLGNAIRLPGRGLAAEDEFFKAIGYRMELRSRAWRRAVVEEGLTGNAAGSRIAEIMSDPATHAPDVHLAAIDYSRYQTFTSKLRFDIARSVAGSRNPVVKAIAPFVSTPWNVMLYSVEHTPAAFLSQRWRKAYSAGGAQRDLAMGQMAFGSMVGAVAVMAAMSGKITGNGPSDPTLRAAWLRAGNKPLSMQVGDWNVDLSRIEWLSTVFGYGADLATLSGWTDDDMSPEVGKLAGALAMTFAKNSTNKTFVEGLSNAIEAMDDPDRYGQQFINNYVPSVTSALPIVGPVGKLTERFISPEKEAISSMADAIWAKVPWVSDTMAKKRDLWGQEITTAMDQDETLAQKLFRINSPIQVTRKGKKSPIDEEFLSLKQAPGMPRKLRTFEGMPYKLDNDEYEEFLLRMNTVELGDGMRLKPSLDQMVQSAEYKEVKKRNESHAFMMIQSKINEAEDRATAQMLESNDQVRKIVDRYHQLQQQQ